MLGAPCFRVASNFQCDSDTRKQACILLVILRRRCFASATTHQGSWISGYLTSTRDQGCVFIKEAYQVYWTSCARGVHTGQMVLKVVEAIGEMLTLLANLFSQLASSIMLFATIIHISMCHLAKLLLCGTLVQYLLQMCILLEQSC